MTTTDTKRLGFVIAQFSALAWVLGQSLKALSDAERSYGAHSDQVDAARQGVHRAVAEIGKAANLLMFAPIVTDFPEVVGASALFNSLAEMVEIYWGQGDLDQGYERPPMCIIRAQEALTSFASAYSQGASSNPDFYPQAPMAAYADANVLADAKLVRRFFEWAKLTNAQGEVTPEMASGAFDRLSFLVWRADAALKARSENQDLPGGIAAALNSLRDADWIGNNQIDRLLETLKARSEFEDLPVTVTYNAINEIVVGRFATVPAAETWIAGKELTDPEGVHAGLYSIDAPEEMVNPTYTGAKK